MDRWYKPPVYSLLFYNLSILYKLLLFYNCYLFVMCRASNAYYIFKGNIIRVNVD